MNELCASIEQYGVLSPVIVRPHSNGGYLNTENLESVEINENSRFCDNNDDEWKLVLLNKHAYSPYIEETNNATWLDMLFLMVRTVLIFIVFYSMYKCKRKSEN